MYRCKSTKSLFKKFTCVVSVTKWISLIISLKILVLMLTHYAHFFKISSYVHMLKVRKVYFKMLLIQLV